MGKPQDGVDEEENSRQDWDKDNVAGSAEHKDEGEGEGEGKYVLPQILLTEFTPQEVSNLQHLFEELDEDGSGSIDVDELGVLFDRLEEEVTHERLLEIIAEVDDDGSGELEYGEFMMLMASFKKGESKFANAGALLEELNSTPIAELERQCRKRGLKLSFKHLETREPTSMAPQQEIYQCCIVGEWIERVDGLIQKIDEPRYFEGIGTTSRDSKMAAAQAALSKLREAIPGSAFEPGTIPEKWYRWYEHNLDQGVPAEELLQTLVVKGFIPAKHLKLMLMTSVHISMQKLVRREPQAHISENRRYIPPEWLDWIEDELARGITGDVVLQMLVKMGFRPERNPHLLQILRQSRGGTVVDPVRPRVLDFWEALRQHDVDEVRRYLKGGQDPNERALHEGVQRTALELIARDGHAEIAISLVAAGARVDTRDIVGRTPLHYAAAGGSRALCEYLIAGAGADVHAQDKYGDSPLHNAVEEGRKEVVMFLTEYQEERLRRFLSGKDGIRGASHAQLVERLFNKMLDERLSPHVPRRFPITWLTELIKRYRREQNGEPLEELVQGAAETMAREKAAMPDPPWGRIPYINDFVEHIDPRDSCLLPPIPGNRVELVLDEYGPEIRTEIFHHADGTEELMPLEMFPETILPLLNKVLEHSFVNCCNTMWRTPLFNAVEPLKTLLEFKHQQVLQILVDDHQADILVRDKQLDSVLNILKREHQGAPGTVNANADVAAQQADEDMVAEEAEAATDNQDSGDEDDKEGGSYSDDEELNTANNLGGASQAVSQQRAMRAVSNPSEKSWLSIRSDSAVVRRVQSWVEYRHNESGMQYYFQQRSGRTSFSTPPEISTWEQHSIGWYELKQISTLVQEGSDGWKQFSDDDGTGDEWYHQSRSWQSQWLKPANFMPLEGSAQYEEMMAEHNHRNQVQRKAQGLWDKVRTLAQDDWTKLRGQSHALRNLGKWTEYRDEETLAVYYYNENTGESSWTKPVRVLDLEKRRFAWDLVVNMERNRWVDLHERSTVLREIDGWQEIRDPATALLIYFNRDVKEYSWKKPEAIETHDSLKFGDEVGEGSIDDWERVGRSSKKLRKFGDWQEFRHPTTEAVFYVNARGQAGGGALLKPSKFLRAERRQYGWEILNTMDELEWKTIRLRSELMRKIDPWEEYRDKNTGICYYREMYKDAYQFTKPEPVLHAERERKSWQMRYVASALVEKIGVWEVRSDAQVTEGKVRDDASLWWTNIESCKIYGKRPAEMDAAMLRRDRRAALTREQTLTEWDEMKQNSDMLRAAGEWEELRHNDTKIIFYYNTDRAEFVFQKPDAVKAEDIQKRGDDIIHQSRPQDWRRMRLESEVLRRAGDWEEHRDKATESLFYYNSVTGESSWHKPEPMHEQEIRERGWQMVNSQNREQWDRLIKQSKLLRVFETDYPAQCVQCWIDRDTKAMFWHDTEKNESSWYKPEGLLEDETSRLAEDLPNGTDREWGLIRMRAEALRRVNAWHEYRDGQSQAVFYYNDDTGHYQLRKPGPVVENEMRKRGWALVRKQSPSEWHAFRDVSEVLRTVLQYDEMRDPETGCVFYVNTKSGTGSCTWQKPDRLNRFEMSERGRALAAKQVDEDWAELRMRGSKLREVGDWFEFRDERTGATFYYHHLTHKYQWKKPEDVDEHDQCVRGWQLVHRYAGDANAVHCEGLWAEHADSKTGAIYFRRTDVQGLEIFEGGCQWEKPAMLIAEEEHAAELARRKRPMDMYRIFMRDRTNLKGLARRSSIVRGPSDMLGTPWEELHDPLTGVTTYRDVDAGTVVTTKPRPVRVFDQEQLYWFLLRKRSALARYFIESEWQEFIDVRFRSFLYYHPHRRLTQWQLPDIVSKAASDRAWKVLLERAETVAGYEDRGPSGWKVLRDTETTAEFYHHGIYGCTWERPQAVDDDQRALRRARQRMERKMHEIEALAEDHHDYDLSAAARELRIDIPGNDIDEFEDFDEPDEMVEFRGQVVALDQLTTEEQQWVLYRNKRMRLAEELEREESQDRLARKKTNVAKQRKRLGTAQIESDRVRYHMSLFIDMAIERKALGYHMCNWGCGEWLLHDEIEPHCKEICPKRMVPCQLGCGLFLRAEFWERVRDSHEENECTKRLVQCPQGCGRSIVFEDLEDHCNKHCAKRRIPPMRCRLGCGKVWVGGMDRFQAMNLERDEHEQEECPEREIPCTWVDIKRDNTRCMAVIKAKNLRAHRKAHLATLGITDYRIPGAHKYRVPPRTRQLKIQLWGAGGGGGHLQGSNNGGGRGGGGGFIEGILEVTPGETIEIVIGEGGAAGVHGKLLTDEGALEQAVYNEGVSGAAAPGGGQGRAANAAWAAGGGGGFSAVFRNGPWGKETILVAGAGGGGGSRNGCAGGGFVGQQTADDPRNGGPGTQVGGGDGGKFPFGENWSWDGPEEDLIGEPGSQWQGGRGGQFGGGGGGGFFGGGGGGCTPGIVGGGGGGSSFASEAMQGVVTLCGHGPEPGGLSRKPPGAIGVGEWDERPGTAGEGGQADTDKVLPGSHGAARIRIPGFFGN